MPFQTSKELSPREVQEHEWGVEAMREAREHTITIKQLEIESEEKNRRVNQWFKIPILIILLPVKIVCAIALIGAYVRKHEPSDNFWKVLGL